MSPDVLLRTAGKDTYDQWVAHKIPFNDPKVVEALGQVAAILKDPKYVNGGFGDVSSIATTTFQDGGQPILQSKCYMHRQASFYASNWPDGTKVAEDGDVWAFYLPAVDSSSKPVLGGGEFVATFRDAPEVKAFAAFLADFFADFFADFLADFFADFFFFAATAFLAFFAFLAFAFFAFFAMVIILLLPPINDYRT